MMRYNPQEPIIIWRRGGRESDDFGGHHIAFRGKEGGTSRHQQSIKGSYGKLTANGGGVGVIKKYYRDLWGKCFSVTTNIVPTSPPLKIATTFPPPGNDYPLFHANTNTFLMNFYFSSCFGGGGSKGWGNGFRIKNLRRSVINSLFCQIVFYHLS